MLAWAEEHHQKSRPEDVKDWPLHTFARVGDNAREGMLTRRGYRNLGPCGYTRWRSLDIPIPDVELPQGYVVRDMQGADEADLEQRAIVNNAAFNSTRSTARTVRVLQKAPTYRQNLDLVTVTPDGAFASFCIVWFGEENRIGWFEPVGTHPDHRRQRLASAVICEGLRRIKALGATMAYVGSGYDPPANRLYETLGFTNFDLYHCWQKRF
jgi:ribosomal protein S18 acetylase RimI-like enzyme